MSRPSARAPGENDRPAALMPTNAEAQRQTETRVAASGSQVRERSLGSGVTIGLESYVGAAALGTTRGVDNVQSATEGVP